MTPLRRSALRTLGRGPGFSAGVILVLALGTGVAGTMFSVLNHALLHPLDLPHADRLMLVAAALPGHIDAAGWWAQARAFSAAAVYLPGGANLSLGGFPDRAPATLVTRDFFDVFRVSPRLGRFFLSGEHVPGSDRVVVLSDDLWSRDFNRSPAALGRTMVLDGSVFTIVGVAPPQFQYPGHTELWVPWSGISGEKPALNLGENMQPDLPGPLSHEAIVARLRRGATLQEADAELRLLGLRLRALTPSATHLGDRPPYAITLEAALTRSSRTALLTLGAGVTLLVLISCAAAAHMLLARAVGRRREAAVRSALGASRAQVASDLMAEAAVLAPLGGCLGLAVARAGVRMVKLFGPASVPGLADIRVDWKVGVLVVSLSTGAGLAIAAVSAAQMTGSNLLNALASMGPGTNRVFGRHSRNALVAAETALTLLLLAGAGLMIRTLGKLTSVSPGFDPKNVLTLSYGISALPLDLPSQAPKETGLPPKPARQPSKAQPEADRLEPSRMALALHRRLEDEIARLPGVVSVGATSHLPLGGRVQRFLYVAGTIPPAECAFSVLYGDFFESLRIPLLAGRAFTAQDDDEGARVAIVNQSLARLLWLDESPLGKALTLQGEDVPRRVVGLVGDVRAGGLGANPVPEAYLPYNQVSVYSMPADMSLVLATRSDPGAYARAVRAAFSRASGTVVAPYDVRPMSEVVGAAAASERFRAWLLGAFALLSFLLAVAGVYAVTAYTVSARTYEIGVRMSLGASPGEILRMVCLEGMRRVFIGTAIGLGAFLALAHLLAGLLYGIAPADPLTLAGSAALLLATALVACMIPGLRAARIDPSRALRYE
ncbi:MAG TPA: ABC transporter permease [Candidatus Acidoferrales bacterium]|nr:ABC transporter permease [Candidatus Acidoferrales bacterium]